MHGLFLMSYGILAGLALGLSGLATGLLVVRGRAQAYAVRARTAVLHR